MSPLAFRFTPFVSNMSLTLESTIIIDTFAEAFKMWGTRLIITADSAHWAMIAAQSITGFATSIIGCKCEAGIECELSPDVTPDGRPGVSVLLFTVKSDDMGKRLLERVGQCILTCPTTACYNGLTIEQGAQEMIDVGGQLRYFGDGFQISKVLGDRRFWRLPVMDGEFLVEELFGAKRAVGGGNLLILGRATADTLRATEAAVAAMREVRGVIMPFPGGIVRSGSKVGSKYKTLFASTNDAYCPTLRGFSPNTQLPTEVGCVLEIVINGLDLSAVEEATRQGMRAAAQSGALFITAGNYGGKLGQFHIHLHKLL